MVLLDELLAFLLHLNDIVELVGKYLGLTLIEVMTLIVLYQVFIRCMLIGPPIGSEYRRTGHGIPE